MAKSYSTFSDMAASNFASISGPTKSTPTKTATTSSKPSTKGGRGIMSAPVSSGDDGGGSTPTKQRVSQQSPAIGLGVYVAEQGAKTNSGDEKGIIESWYDWAFGNGDEDDPIITPDAESESLQEDTINTVLNDRDFPLDPRTNLPVGALPRQRYVIPTDPLALASLEGSTQGFNPSAIATGLEVAEELRKDEQGRPMESLVPRPRPSNLNITTPQEMQEELPSNIDFGFIGEQEGDRPSMYVPMSNGRALDSSGPTIGMGVDLGQKSPEELLGLPEDLRQKLEPYTELRGQEAVRFVQNNPLTLTDEERETINAWSKQQETSRLISLWERDSDIPWQELTTPQATTVASVMYQYGSYRVRTPNFWRAATSGDWDAVESELRDFGDKYGPRRVREANYLTGN